MTVFPSAVQSPHQLSHLSLLKLHDDRWTGCERTIQLSGSTLIAMMQAANLRKGDDMTRHPVSVGAGRALKDRHDIVVAIMTSDKNANDGTAVTRIRLPKTATR
jgi:hypothetical protein